jgi:hypothetical protein
MEDNGWRNTNPEYDDADDAEANFTLHPNQYIHEHPSGSGHPVPLSGSVSSRFMSGQELSTTRLQHPGPLRANWLQPAGPLQEIPGASCLVPELPTTQLFQQPGPLPVSSSALRLAPELPRAPRLQHPGPLQTPELPRAPRLQHPGPLQTSSSWLQRDVPLQDRYGASSMVPELPRAQRLQHPGLVQASWLQQAGALQASLRASQRLLPPAPLLGPPASSPAVNSSMRGKCGPPKRHRHTEAERLFCAKAAQKLIAEGGPEFRNATESEKIALVAPSVPYEGVASTGVTVSNLKRWINQIPVLEESCAQRPLELNTQGKHKGGRGIKKAGQRLTSRVDYVGWFPELEVVLDARISEERAKRVRVVTRDI